MLSPDNVELLLPSGLDDSNGRSGPIPQSRGEHFLIGREAFTLVARKPSSTVSLLGTHSCAPGDNSGPCQKPVDATSNTTLPIVLGVVIPLTVALVILIVLHRRHVKKLRIEDANDRHKSLDFGMGEAGNNKKSKNKHASTAPPMVEITPEEISRRARGLSMDMLSSPYLLPPGLQQSRESLHSLSRSFHQDDDKYRPATTVVADGTYSYPSSLRSPVDDNSSFTGSSRRRFDAESGRHMVRHPHRMSGKPGSVRSMATNPVTGEKGPNPSNLRNGAKPGSGADNLNIPGLGQSARESFVSTRSAALNPGVRASNDYLGAYIRGGLPGQGPDPEKSKPVSPISGGAEKSTSSTPVEGSRPPTSTATTVHDQMTVPTPPKDLPMPPQADSYQLPDTHSDERHLDRNQAPEREPRLPQLSFVDTVDHQTDFRLPEIDPDVNQSKDTQVTKQPLEDVTNQPRPLSRQQRASTIPNGSAAQAYEALEQQRESSYDYYDEYEEYENYRNSQLSIASRPLPPDDPSESQEQRANRIRSFYKEYFDESKTPGATPTAQQQPVAYFDGSENYVEEQDYYDEPEYYDHMPQPPRGPRRDYAGSERHRPTYSTGSYRSSPRAMSTGSGGWGYQQQRRPPPKKRMPPPKPLHNLPTPSMLNDDSALSMDFAPPVSYQERNSGRPDSLRGGVRPFSPHRPARNPLASSFDDLAALPSP